jgi:polyisoprenoid-binding protein YceI
MPIRLSRRTLIASGLAAWATSAFSAGKSYELVAEGSRVSFIFTLSGAPNSGTIPIKTADIRVDPENLARSTATVTADVRNIRSGLFFITEAIKSAELLDAERHPTVRFTSNRMQLGAKGRISEGARIDGELTLRGVTRPITLDATLSRPPGTKPDDLSVLYIRLTGTLSRSEYGATGYAGLADDTVSLDILAEIRERA